MSMVWPVGRVPPRAAFKQLLRTESLLVVRQRTGLVLGFGLPVVLLVVFGSAPAFAKSQPNLGGLSYLDIYLPILVALVLNNVGLFSLPPVLASYRESGILRRLSTTPLPPSWVLAVQLIVNFYLAVASVAIVVILGVAAFGLHFPRNPGGFVLAALLSIAALFALGLWISAIAHDGTAARVIGQFFFVPLMFFAGLWIPQPVMPTTLREISQYTPVGASVQALQSAVLGAFPPASSLLVLVGYAIVFGFLAVRSFTWE